MARVLAVKAIDNLVERDEDVFKYKKTLEIQKLVPVAFVEESC